MKPSEGIVRRVLDYEGKGIVTGEVLSFKRGVFAGGYVVGEMVIMYVIWLVGKSLRTISQKSIG